VEGVDYAWQRPTVARLVAAGKRFACRYVGPGSEGKQLDRAEARALSAAGIAIVANAEGADGGMLGGRPVGRSWAREAHDHAVACGMWPPRPIYLSCDFDVTARQWPAVREALAGAAEVLGHGRVGLYGSYRAISWAVRDHAAAWLWQTYAWSSNPDETINWHPRAHLRQYRNEVALGGGIVDLDRSMVADFGQWMIGDDMTPEQAQELKDIWYAHFVYDNAAIRPPRTIIGRILSLQAQTTALQGVVEQLAGVIAAGGGTVNTAEILAGVDERLAVYRAGVEDDARDMVGAPSGVEAEAVDADTPEPR